MLWGFTRFAGGTLTTAALGTSRCDEFHPPLEAAGFRTGDSMIQEPAELFHKGSQGYTGLFWTMTLWLQIAQSRSYLYTLGPKMGIFTYLEPKGGLLGLLRVLRLSGAGPGGCGSWARLGSGAGDCQNGRYV